MSEETAELWITGFWRRIGAFAIDLLLLGLLGFGLGSVLASTFVEMGGWGRLVGFIIALIYFGLLNSEIGKGQTIGKRLLKIKVVDANNQAIAVPKSMLRYSILGIPFFLNNAQFSIEVLTSPMMYLLSLVLFGGLFSTLYLYIFNRNTRQSLHDLIVKTYVVNDTVSPQSVTPIWKTHVYVTASIIIAAAIVPYFTLELAKQQPFAQMLTVQDVLAKEPGVMYVLVQDGKTFSSENETTYISAQVFINENKVNDKETGLALARKIKSTFTESVDRNFIIVSLVHGYDIGIASAWSQHTFRYNPMKL